MYKIRRLGKVGKEQKEFTRAEKAAFREIYKATGGLRYLPKTASVRDVQRFNKLSTDLRHLSLGNSSKFDRENAKQLLLNSNMPISASQVDSLIAKYTNKRALARLSRIKNRKGTNIDVDAIRKPYYMSSKIMNRGADVKEAADEAFNQMHDAYKPDPKMIKKLTRYAKKKDIKVERLPNHPNFNGKFDSFVETMPDMSKTIEGKYIGRIVQNTGALEGDLAHEIGHIRTFKSRTGKEIKKFRGRPEYPQLIRRTSRGKAFLDDKNYTFQKTANNIIGIANENSATAYGNALMKRLNSTSLVKRPSRMRINAETQSHALSGYIGQSTNHLGHDIRESLRWI